jgi:hypothetical protein
VGWVRAIWAPLTLISIAIVIYICIHHILFNKPITSTQHPVSDIEIAMSEIKSSKQEVVLRDVSVVVDDKSIDILNPLSTNENEGL